METLFDELPEDTGLDICEVCWEDEGFHFSWCPTQQKDAIDIPVENVYNQTIDEEIMMMEEDDES